METRSIAGTTPNIAAPIEVQHAANLQERERGQLKLIAGLRASNKAMAYELHAWRDLGKSPADVGERIRALEEAADPTGEGCSLHGHAPHGQEAEELRNGLEVLLSPAPDDGERDEKWKRDIRGILDQVSARDSLAHVRANEELGAVQARVAELEQQLAEANARAETERAANLANTAELHRASALITEWKEKAERAEARNVDLQAFATAVNTAIADQRDAIRQGRAPYASDVLDVIAERIGRPLTTQPAEPKPDLRDVLNALHDKFRGIAAGMSSNNSFAGAAAARQAWLEAAGHVDKAARDLGITLGPVADEPKPVEQRRELRVGDKVVVALNGDIRRVDNSPHANFPYLVRVDDADDDVWLTKDQVSPAPSTISAKGGEPSPKRVYWWEFFGYLGGAFAHGGE